MAGIFISYRRDDSAGYTGRLVDALKESFEPQQIFRDIEAIEAGADFVEAIDNAVASCSVVLAVLGPRWLSATDAKGQPRLEAPNDFVRLEIAAALKRNIKVIPVLVGGATMPAAEELPEPLKPLARRQAHEITDRRWDYDVHELFAALDKVPGIAKRKGTSNANVAAPPAPPPKAGMSSGLKVLLAVIGAIGVLVVIGLAQEANQPDTPDLAQPPASTTAAVEPQAVSPPPVQPSAPPAPSIPAAQSKPPVVPSAPPVQSAAAPANLTGNWRTSDGDAFYIEHSGGELAVLAADASTQHGFMGQGMVRGQQVDLTLRHIQSGLMMSMRMHISADGRQMSGVAREHVTGSSQNIVLTRD